MFRKYYKEANDSIKPSEDFVNSVIRDAKKHKPPLRARYTQYAAVAAAAVVVVTGAVTALPMLQKAQRDGGEGIVIEERAMESGSTAAPSQNAVPTSAPETAVGNAGNTAQSPIQEPKQDTPNTSENSYRVPDNAAPPKRDYFPTDESEQYHGSNDTEETESAPQPNIQENEMQNIDEPAQEPEVEKNSAEENMDSDEGGGNSGGSSGGSNAKAILGESDEVIKQENTAPEDMTPYSEKRDLSGISEADTEAIDDADIPCPDGYYCIDASPNGYTFKNDDGAVISVTINYGGADREPYITEEDGSIYAVFTSFGLSVTINAYGADMAAVEEIINQFR